MKSWVKFGLIWGVFMGLMLTVVFPLLDGSEIHLNKILVSIPIWLVGGLLFGYVSRKKNPKTDQ